MALTHSRVTEAATRCKELADKLKATLAEVEEFIDTNSDLSIDWAAGSTPSYINEDADGNLDGLGFTRQQVANAVGSFDNIRKVFRNEAATQGDHLGNLNHLADVNPSG